VILGIDTSLGTAVAVVDPDGLVRAEASSTDPLGHAEAIGRLLAAALADAQVGALAGPPEHAAVTHVAAGMGPGPFTGLRVGIAAARAFALGRGIPVVPVVSHDAIALAHLLGIALTGADAEPFAVVTDARRREFAFTVYDGLDDDGLPVRTTEPSLTPRDEIGGVLVGLGVARVDGLAVSAAMIATVAARALAAGRRVSGDDALYLRSPDVTLRVQTPQVSA
jgi:tRNA threonylcarbamoyl adenosine modification protein YeaZ